MKHEAAGKIAVGLIVFGIVGMAVTAGAIPISQTDFGPGAIVYGFDEASIDQETVTSGILTVKNGVVYPATFDGGMESPVYYDGGDPSVIRFDFSTPVPAVGASFYANKENITLSVYDSSDTVLESYTIDWTTLPRSTLSGQYPYGFIGIDYGSPSISYALVDTPLIGKELYVDNITYHPSAPVPEPATLFLFSTGIAGLAWIRLRRRRNQPSEGS